MKKTIKGKGRSVIVIVDGEREFYSKIPKFEEKREVKVEVIIK